MKRLLALLCIGFQLLWIGNSLFAQHKMLSHKEKQQQHKEQPEDAYLPHPDARGQVSKAYYYRDALVETHQVNVNANGQNIIGDAANEPSLAVDPNNPNKMIIGWRQFDNINSNFRQAGYAFTTNGGQTWTFPGSINSGVFRSDPVLDIDTDGTFYYNSLTSNDGIYTCKVFRSTDGGQSWDEGVEAKGGDKQWMVIDKTDGPGKDNNYSYWTSYWSSCQPGNFTRSVDKGESYGPCVSVLGDPYWGTLAVAPDGALYISGSGWYGIMVAKSTNAQHPLVSTSWDFYTDVNMDGDITSGADVNPGGLLGQANIAVDYSTSACNGNVYVLASIARNNGDPGDVMFSRSIDGGLSWTNPHRVNQDFSFSNTQWFGTMSVAPNGRIDAVWLDTRDAPAGLSRMSALYYSYSVNQGETWSINQRISESFDPHVGWPNQEKMGDYFHSISDDGGVHLAWANTLNGGQDVYYSRIALDLTAVQNNLQEPLLLSVFPNPVAQKAQLTYQSSSGGTVNIQLFDVRGKLMYSTNETEIKVGTNSTILNLGDWPNGVYFCTLSTAAMAKTIKIIKR